MWRTTAIDNKKPVAAGTHDDGGPVSYTNTGVYGDHAYSILGYETAVRVVQRAHAASGLPGAGAPPSVLRALHDVALPGGADDDSRRAAPSVWP